MKKILFLILLLIPLTVNAFDYGDLGLIWQVEKEYTNNDQVYKTESYEMANTFIYYSDTKFLSIDKQTGATKEADIFGRHFKTNNKIVLADDENHQIYLIVYDEYLNIISKTDLNSNRVVAFTSYDSNYYILVTVNYTIENTITKIFFIDEEGNIDYTDELKLRTSFQLYTHYSNPDKFILIDGNFNFFDIENYQIKPRYVNSDGSFMYQENTKLSKISSTGEVINELEIPNGRGTRIAKKGDYYYVATGIYDWIDTNNVIINLKIFLIDEDLNILRTVTTENTREYNFKNPVNQNNDLPYYIHNIMNYEGNIYCEIDSSTYAVAYEVGEDLSLTPSISHSFEYYSPYNRVSLNSDYPYPLDSVSSGSKYNQLRRDILNKYPNLASYKFRTDNENIYALVVFTKQEDESDGPVYYSKGVFEGYDENLNELFSVEVFDWTPIDSKFIYNPESIEWDVGENLFSVDDKILLFFTDPAKNHLVIYDKQGNIIKDLSNYLEEYYFFDLYSIRVTEKGILTLFGPYRDSIKGAFKILDDESQNTFVLGDIEFDIPPKREVWLFFSDMFNIQTKITGEGTITATETEAKEGTEIRFTVTPKKGYVLSAIKVTDANGNVLTFNDYTFTMPSANVTIEATFVLAATNNPSTGDIAIIAITILAILSSIVLIIQKKKLDFLK